MQALYAPVLTWIHFDLLRQIDSLKALEIDLDRAGSYFKVLSDMQLLHKTGLNVMKKSIRDWKNCNLNMVGLMIDR